MHLKKPIELRKSETNNAREQRAFLLEVRASEDGVIEGYGSVFNVEDDWSDIVAPGAFNQSLAAHKSAKTMPAMLWQHDSDSPIGIWTEMVEDAKGLRIKGQLALETTLGKEAFSLLKMGAINGLSIGFITKKWSYDAEKDIRTVTEVDLWEVSLVTFPANRAARVTTVKASDIPEIKTIRQSERALRDAGFSDDAAKALVAQIKRLALDERDAHELSKTLKAADRLLTALTN